MTGHSPTPPNVNGGKKKEQAWEFSAIPWTFPLDQAQTIEGWEPFAFACITVTDSADPDAVLSQPCLLVRRPA